MRTQPLEYGYHDAGHGVVVKVGNDCLDEISCAVLGGIEDNPHVVVNIRTLPLGFDAYSVADAEY
jgi:hypothetical protein